MSDLSFYKKLKLLSLFKKVIRSSKIELSSMFNLRVDRSYRLYTVINVPSEYIGEPYNIKKSDIDGVSQTFIKEYINSVSGFLDSKGLGELYDFYKVDKVDKYSYLVIIGFKLIKTDELYTRLYTRIIPITLFSILFLSIVYFLIK